MIAAIKDLIATTGMNVKQAISALNIPETDRSQYVELLKKCNQYWQVYRAKITANEGY